MGVTIVIERKLREDVTPENFRVINALRRGALQQRGYISGETLINFDKNTVVVLSYWSELDDWKRWERTEERQKIERELTSYLEEPARIRYFISAADFKKTFE